MKDTLSKISPETGMSLPTLQRYKKLYQERIPAARTRIIQLEKVRKARTKQPKRAKPAAKKPIARKARKRSVLKHIAPPYSADQIRTLLGITQKDIQVAQRWLESTVEERGRKPSGKSASPRVKRATTHIVPSRKANKGKRVATTKLSD
jgi:hypothetical protein